MMTMTMVMIEGNGDDDNDDYVDDDTCISINLNGKFDYSFLLLSTTTNGQIISWEIERERIRDDVNMIQLLNGAAHETA